MSEKNIFEFNNEKLEYLFEKRNSKKLVILIHGYGANMHDLFDLNYYLDRDENCDFIFPNGPLKIPMGISYEGRAWFPIDMSELEKHMKSGTHRSFEDLKPNGLEKSLKLMKAFIKTLVLNYDEVILGGFSQGAMLVSLLLKDFKEIKKAIFFSGNLISKGDLASDYTGLEFTQSHGSNDPVLGIYGANRLFEELTTRGAKGEFTSFPGGHEIPMEAIEKASFLIKK